MAEKNIKSLRFNSESEEINLNELSADMFETVDTSTRQSVEVKHASIGFWQDVWRRFKANKISMIFVFVFILIMLYAIVGPMIVPYSYETQFRSGVGLKPMSYSESEIIGNKALESCDYAFSTDLMDGSMQALTKGDWYFELDGKTYTFTVDKTIKKSVIMYTKGADPAFTIGDLGNVNEDGYFNSVEPFELPVEGTPSAEAREITFTDYFFIHVLGTDDVGRDIFARTMYGSRISLLIGFAAAIIIVGIGSAIGAISGLLGGKVDMVIMRIIDLLGSIPSILMIILLQVIIQDPLQDYVDHNPGTFLAELAGGLGFGVISILVIFALLYWTGVARLIRGLVLQLRNQEFITAESVLGAENKRIILKHLLPNCMGQLVLAACGQVPGAIFTESSLSYLGIGVSAPMTSLGSLCNEALGSILVTPYRLIAPAVIVSLLVLSLNLIGDGLRDALDPRLK